MGWSGMLFGLRVRGPINASHVLFREAVDGGCRILFPIELSPRSLCFLCSNSFSTWYNFPAFTSALFCSSFVSEPCSILVLLCSVPSKQFPPRSGVFGFALFQRSKSICVSLSASARVAFFSSVLFVATVQFVLLWLTMICFVLFRSSHHTISSGALPDRESCVMFCDPMFGLSSLTSPCFVTKPSNFSFSLILRRKIVLSKLAKFSWKVR
jgi:hypothetical protein